MTRERREEEKREEEKDNERHRLVNVVPAFLFIKCNNIPTVYS